MNILGPDELIFGVENVEECRQYLCDYGLEPAGNDLYTALDGTGIRVKPSDDPELPAALESGSTLRKTIYGVADDADIAAIAAELEKDREVVRLEDGSIQTVDDLGFVLGFRKTVRKTLSMPSEEINAPGAPIKRPVNVIGVDPNATPRPRTFSHVVYFVPDAAKAEQFYRRLGFVTSDRLGGSPFMRPAGTQDHHTLFMIQTPPFMQGLEHLTFHMGGPTEMMQAGTRFLELGHQSFWGPGRHIMGSNWFWYFKSPFGCNFEYDADMDQHDDSWQARDFAMNEDNSQVFLFQYREKWSPGPGK